MATNDTGIQEIAGPSRFRMGAGLVALVTALVAISVTRLLVGIPYGWPSAEVLELRVGNLAIGLTVGAALSVSGVLLQALLRNPLASPYVLGLSSGASLGFVLAGLVASLGGISASAFGVDHTAAVGGALAVMGVVYILGQRRGRIDPLGLLLVGVIVNAINGAAIMFITVLVRPDQRGQMALWMLGFFNQNVTPLTIAVVAGITLVGTCVAIGLGRATDVATLSSVEAHGLGLRLHRLRIILFVLSGILTAGTVLLAGPIGFVGLVCPHLVRLMLGPRHRMLVLGSALAGAALLVGADVAVRLLDVELRLGQMPIGMLTALIGGPVFLWMLRPRLGRGTET